MRGLSRMCHFNFFEWWYILRSGSVGQLLAPGIHAGGNRARSVAAGSGSRHDPAKGPSGGKIRLHAPRFAPSIDTGRDQARTGAGEYPLPQAAIAEKLILSM